MSDPLGVVYQFVRDFAYQEGESSPLSEDQVIRGWQNSSFLPAGTTEFCVLTLRDGVRQGSNVYRFTDDGDNMIMHVKKNIDLSVQIDFNSAEPYIDPIVTRNRAEIVEQLINSYIGPAYFKQKDEDLSVLYAEDVKNLSGFDETKTFTARYMVMLHLSQRIDKHLPIDYFTSVRIKTENVDVHHPIH